LQSKIAAKELVSDQYLKSYTDLLTKKQKRGRPVGSKNKVKRAK
jgi:hypothetical protein